MEVGLILAKMPEYRSYSAGKILVDSSTFIGVECEFERVNKKLPMTDAGAYSWAQHVDGSLRDSGLEFTFNGPLFGQDAETAINWLIPKAKEAGYATSVRTGLHVHLDVRNLSSEELMRLCLLYSFVEPLLFAWAGKHREESVFCVPWYYATAATKEAGALLQHLTKAGAGDTPSLLLAEKIERYAALNLQALSRFGSVEFRHMEMTFDISRINLLLRLKMAAVDVKFKVDPDIRDPERYLGNIFKDQWGELASKCGNISKLIHQGFKTYSILKQGATPVQWGDPFKATGGTGPTKNSGFSRWIKNNRPDLGEEVV
jgi:hypothetical protein